jgi:hypothetical protein
MRHRARARKSEKARTRGWGQGRERAARCKAGSSPPPSHRMTAAPCEEGGGGEQREGVPRCWAALEAAARAVPERLPRRQCPRVDISLFSPRPTRAPRRAKPSTHSGGGAPRGRAASPCGEGAPAGRERERLGEREVRRGAVPRSRLRWTSPSPPLHPLFMPCLFSLPTLRLRIRRCCCNCD